MKTSKLISIASITIILLCIFIVPEASAQYVGGSFESKVSGETKLIDILTDFLMSKEVKD